MIFVETKSSWFIGSSHHYLSFSSDGTTIAGTTKAPNSPDQGQVQFWETATGATTSSFERSSFVVFSPTDPDIAVLVRSGSIHMVKRDSFGGKTWGGQNKHNTTTSGAVSTFNSNGKTIVVSLWNRGTHFVEYDATSWSNPRATSKRTRKRETHFDEYDTTSWSTSNPKAQAASKHFVYQITSVVCCPIKPGWFIVGDNQGHLDVVSNTDKDTLKSHCRISPVDPVRVSACAWSQDGKWIATGNDDGDIFLWNAGVPSHPTSVSFAMLLPRNRHNTNSEPTTSLVFVPDSTGLIIVSGGYLSVWDIQKVEYVANSGLPDMAMNIALDGFRNRLAVVVNERISIYELKLPEEKCQTDGKSSILSRAEFDITNAIVKFDPEPFVGPYFNIYRGAWKPDTPRIFQHVVAIKALRPASKPRAGRQNFEDVRKLNFVPLVNIQ
jgi:hypothetical protein